MRGRLIRIPRTGPRNCPYAFAKLLTRVDPSARAGGFDGTLMRPGKTVEESALYPEGDYNPPAPVLLECAGPIPGAGRGHNRAPSLWLLWQYDRQENRWREIARSVANDWTWRLDLLHVAARALTQEARRGQAADVAIAAERIAAAIDAELSGLETGDQERCLAVVDHFLAARICGLQGD